MLVFDAGFRIWKFGDPAETYRFLFIPIHHGTALGWAIAGALLALGAYAELARRRSLAMSKPHSEDHQAVRPKQPQ